MGVYGHNLVIPNGRSPLHIGKGIEIDIDNFEDQVNFGGILFGI